MADAEYEPAWRICDECQGSYFIGAVHNPRRNHKIAPIALSRVPSAEVVGNFQVDITRALVRVYDADDVTLGMVPIVIYGIGPYRPHNPSHFLDDIHVHEGDSEWKPTRRPNNFKMRMDDV